MKFRILALCLLIASPAAFDNAMGQSQPDSGDDECVTVELASAEECGTEKVTSEPLCGTVVINDKVRCGSEYVVNGAVCGWEIVTDSARCGFKTVGRLLGGRKPKSCKVGKRCEVAKSCRVAATCDVARTCEVQRCGEEAIKAARQDAKTADEMPGTDDTPGSATQADSQ